MTPVPRERPSGASRWLGRGLALAGAALVPWIAALALELPASERAYHWAAAWAGLDSLEAVTLLATGVLLLRGDSRRGLAAAAAATALALDAWFDVATSAPGAARAVALAMASGAELPLAAVCVLIALRAGRPPAPWPTGRLAAVRVLLLGSGGREHALARSLASDPDVTELHVAPGNPGMAPLATLHPVNLADVAEVAALAARLGPALVVVGPEAPLVAGLADTLRGAGLACFGPSRRAAMIEGSKSFAKQVMVDAGIPTARARTCQSAQEVQDALRAFGSPYVVKADGLAAGKGVVVTEDLPAALAHARAAGTVVIEEFLDGPEVSLFALSDGADAVPLLPAQDFKRAQDGDGGPNTGGMGAYAPLPWAPPGLADEVMATVVRPAIEEMRRRGTPYRGLLYAGLSLTSAGIRVVEFNARFGDPETQVVLDRLRTPLAGLLAAAASGSLAGAGPLEWAPGAAVTVVVAAEGYPVAPVVGDAVEGLDDAERTPGAYVLHAGTALDQAGRLVSSGGRVLNVVGSGPDLASARAAAYSAAERIRMRGGWCRRDIAEDAAKSAS